MDSASARERLVGQAWASAIALVIYLGKLGARGADQKGWSSMRDDLPSGTVTFLFAEVTGSGQPIRLAGEDAASLFATQRKILRAAFQKYHGREVEARDTFFFIAFARAEDAAAASIRAQRALAEHAWAPGASPQVRMGLHTGTPRLTAEGYSGLDAQIAARLCEAAHGGQVLLSQAARQLIEPRLEEGVSLRDLGEHQLKDLEQPRRIFQLVIPDLPDEFPPLYSLDALPHNLPIQLTSFVGRKRELAELERLLGTTRLLTLTGAGGAGKTRLALQMAAEAAESFAHGVWFVELAALTDPTLVPQAVTTTLGVREQPGQSPRASLQAHLRSKHLLLILDNCEHLIDACAQLADSLLRACPNLTILATSREPLGIVGETALVVPSLALPAEEEPHLAFDVVSQYDAVQLFVDRALAVQPGFKLTELNAGAIVQVCRRLDGIPLAIELAAARIKMLQTAELAARLDDRFSLLTGGSRTALPRQQTLRRTIDWSYDLLSEPERALLQRSAVFAGGFTLEAAEQVTGGGTSRAADLDSANRAVLPANTILDHLSRLVDKSLVFVNRRGDATRYEMLETIRQYAREKLAESGELEETQDRHLDFFLALAEDAEQHFWDDSQALHFRRLELEHDNLRAALERSNCCADKHAAGLRLAGALGFFWRARGYFAEGRGYLLAMLQRNPAHGEARAKALFGIGCMAYRQGDFAEARAYMDEGLAEYQELGEAGRRGFANTIAMRGYLETEVGDYQTAARLIGQSLAIMRELNDTQGIAHAYQELGACALRAGDYQKASEYLEQALPLYQQIDPQGRALALSGLAEIAIRRGEYERADELEQKALNLRRELADKWAIAISLGNLAWIALRRGDLARSTALLKESAVLRSEIGDPGGLAWCLEKFAAIALLEAQPDAEAPDVEALERAATLFGAAAALRAPIRSVIDLVDQPEYERQLAVLRERLGAANYARARAHGEAMTPEQAIALGQVTSAPAEADARTQGRKGKKGLGELTGRERQVAALLAQGASNREIAKELDVSERTVETHVSNILNKLGFSSRAEVRKWARRGEPTKQSE